MRIAFFTDIFLEVPGGIPSSIKAQQIALESLGHQVTIFCPGWQKLPKHQHIIVIPTHRFLRPNKAPLAKKPEEIIKFIKKLYPDFANSFDLIHVHYEASCSIAGVKLAKANHLKLIQTMHGREDIAIDTNVPFPIKYPIAFMLNSLHRIKLSSIYTKPVLLQKDHYLIKNSVQKNMWELMVRQARIADLVISPSKHFAKNLEHYKAAKKVYVVSNGIDDQQVQQYIFHIRNFNSNTPLHIIWSSRVSKEKRILPFLESIANSKNLKKIKLTIIGSGNQLQEAKIYAKMHFSKKQVIFLGQVPHEKIFKYLQNGHLSIINSYGFDTQGMTILEATACGLPVLYADPAMDEVVPKGGGIRAKDQSITAMTESIDYVFNHPELIQKMSQNMLKARQSVLESTQIKHLLELYQK